MCAISGPPYYPKRAAWLRNNRPARTALSSSVTLALERLEPRLCLSDLHGGAELAHAPAQGPAEAVQRELTPPGLAASSPALAEPVPPNEVVLASADSGWERAKQLWNGLLVPYLADDLWSARDAYDAGHYLMVPLHAAFSLAQTSWQQGFSDQFRRMVEVDGLLNREDRLNCLQYLYLASRFVVLAESAGKPQQIPPGLVDLLYAQVEDFWQNRPAWQWNRPAFEGGIRERLAWKLDTLEVDRSYYRAILDEELFVVAIAADLAAYARRSARPDLRTPLVEEILGAAERVFQQEVVFVEGAGWILQPGVWTDHADYLYAGHDELAPDLAPSPVPGIAPDSSHSHRMPLWLTSLAGAYAPGSSSRAHYEYLKRRLERQFAEVVLVQPNADFPGYRTTNYLDGRNGIFRYGYPTTGTGSGYGPYELSGTLWLGWWSFLASDRVRARYQEMSRQFPLSDDVIDGYVGPNTTRQRHPLVTLPDAFQNGFLELIALLAGQGPTEETVRNLGTIESAGFGNERLVAPETWYQFTAAHTAIATVEALFRHADGDVNLDVYDDGRNLLASSHSTADYERIDFAASADETYHVRAAGSNPKVDFRLTNLVLEQEGEITVLGTSSDDAFTFAAGATHLVTVNGVRYEFAGQTVSAVGIDGRDGRDTLVLTATPADERAELRPGSVELAGDGIEVHGRSLETICLHSGGGNDVAKLYDSPGNDTFIATPGQGTLFGEEFWNRAVAFRYVHAWASGGTDVAKLYDQPEGDDRFVATPNYGVLYNDQFFARAVSFPYLHAYSSGGVDVAQLHDDPEGDDRFVATPDYGVLYNDRFFARAVSFPYLHAYSSGGADVARLYDDPQGDDRFVAAPDYAVLYGERFFTRVVSFPYVHAYALGGADVAALHDDPERDDRFVATPDWALIQNDQRLARAVSFRYVSAYASGGADWAFLYDSPLVDQLRATADWARLSNEDPIFGFSNRAHGFRLVKAWSSNEADSKQVDAAALDWLILEGWS